MSVRRSLLLPGILIGTVICSVGPRAQAPSATLHAVGDLPGGAAYTLIRDATRAGDTIYAVGGAVVRLACEPPACLIPTRVDTPILWAFDGTAATVTPLPDFTANLNSVRGAANDITPDGRYIASQAAGGGNWAVRVDSTLLPSALANVNIQQAMSPQFLDPMLPAGAISSDGTILYGATAATAANGNISRVSRFDLPIGTRTLIPTLGLDNQNSVAPGGTSSDGSVAVGDSFTTGLPSRAYRYVHNVGTTAIPLLPGGTFNRALSVTPDGDVVLLAGDAAGDPESQPYLYRASTGAIELLGKPNTKWRVGGRICAAGTCNTASISGRVTADTSVVVTNFFEVGGDSYAYFRNSHGWFHLSSALLANGVNLAANGWGRLVVQGISADGTLVFGAGDRNGVVEGFVAEFAPGALASFNPPFVPPADSSIVGAWIIGGEPLAPEAVAVFTADGAYYQIEDDTFEWGNYSYDSTGLSIVTRHDTNGSAGLSDDSGNVLPLQVIGDEIYVDGELQALRIVGSQGSILGAWIAGVPTEADNAFVIVAAPGNHYFVALDLPENEAGESGTYVWDPITHEMSATPFGGETDSGNFLTPSPDGLGLRVVDEGDDSDFARVVDPASIPVIGSSLVADGAIGHPFSFAVSATNTQTFGAENLPAGLSIDPIRGAISGVPEVGGNFSVTVFATNGNGISDIESLALSVIVPTVTEIGQNVVVQPEAPAGQGEVTLSFGEVTGEGTTAVTVIDPAEVPSPPGNFNVVGVIYDVTTTATFEGLITLCFSYADLDLGGSTPRLLHFEDDVWVDITTTVDTNTQTVCGATTSLSPFALVVSPVERVGFYAPVNPLAGFLNTVKGGSTVPLKFNVRVNGTEKTTVDGLELTMHPIPCDSDAPEDPVEQFPYSGGTDLRYDSAGHFIANWKVPKAPGLCYMIRMTTIQDGLALTARFKVK